ncbi:hypothetical protein WMF26_28760 [Sorangium sp. So ce185]
MANHLEWAASIRDEGIVREPFCDRLSAVVHEADIAAVAVAALTQDGHAGKKYTLTGPEVLRRDLRKHAEDRLHGRPDRRAGDRAAGLHVRAVGPRARGGVRGEPRAAEPARGSGKRHLTSKKAACDVSPGGRRA